MTKSHPKTARPDHEILDVIQRRWSPRAFDSDRDVAREDLLRLFEAARWAPSAGNEQPWRFVASSRRHSPEAFAALLSSLLPKNRAWADVAPVLVLVAVNEAREPGYSPSAAWYDAGQAVAFLTLQATSMGLSVRQMEGFDTARAREVCAVPVTYAPAVVMAIGYAGDPSALSIEKHRDAERQPRSRRPVGEFVFEDAWGRTLR
jgi:nitroreductase